VGQTESHGFSTGKAETLAKGTVFLPPGGSL
jgi:hypothetical protein